MTENAESVRGHAYVVPCNLHIFARDAAEAERLIEQMTSVVFDAGPVTLTSKLGRLEALYINEPDNEVTEGDAAYDYPFDNDAARAEALRLAAQNDGSGAP